MKQILKNKNALLAVLIVGIIAMTVAFAAVSSQLNIFGTAKISSGSYKVVIDDWASASTPSLVSGATNTGYQITAASVTSNTMTISGLKVGFKQPGDAVKYTFNIENQGTIDAAIDSFTLSTPTCTNASTSENVTCPGLTYEVKCGSPAATPAAGDNLLAGQTIPCYYYLAYNVVDASSLNQPAIEVGNINASWTYTQKATNSYTPQTTKYKLTLNSMGGSSVSNIEALGGSEITLPEPTKDGYEFDGWYTEETEGTKITTNTMPTSNTTYYAHWFIPAICKKATTLHTETCNSGSSNNTYCYGDGYYSGGSKGTTTITYGHTNLTNGEMTAGYALDCDVTGEGNWERFYYVSDYYDNSTQTFNNNYAVLAYYSSVYNGVASNTGTSYSSRNQIGSSCTLSRGCNWFGPKGGVNHLPTTSQWNNITLKTSERQLLAYDMSQGYYYSSTTGGDLPVFSYSGKAARLLTVNELINGCQILPGVQKQTSKCNFLFENTIYANNAGALGTMLETPYYNSSTTVYILNSQYGTLTHMEADTYQGVRPVIEVPYSKIQLQ